MNSWRAARQIADRHRRWDGQPIAAT